MEALIEEASNNNWFNFFVIFVNVNFCEWTATFDQRTQISETFAQIWYGLAVTLGIEGQPYPIAMSYHFPKHSLVLVSGSF